MISSRNSNSNWNGCVGRKIAASVSFADIVSANIKSEKSRINCAGDSFSLGTTDTTSLLPSPSCNASDACVKGNTSQECGVCSTATSSSTISKQQKLKDWLERTQHRRNENNHKLLKKWKAGQLTTNSGETSNSNFTTLTGNIQEVDDMHHNKFGYNFVPPSISYPTTPSAVGAYKAVDALYAPHYFSVSPYYHNFQQFLMQYQQYLFQYGVPLLPPHLFPTSTIKSDAMAACAPIVVAPPTTAAVRQYPPPSDQAECYPTSSNNNFYFTGGYLPFYRRFISAAHEENNCVGDRGSGGAGGYGGGGGAPTVKFTMAYSPHVANTTFTAASLPITTGETAATSAFSAKTPVTYNHMQHIPKKSTDNYHEVPNPSSFSHLCTSEVDSVTGFNLNPGKRIQFGHYFYPDGFDEIDDAVLDTNDDDDDYNGKDDDDDDDDDDYGDGDDDDDDDGCNNSNSGGSDKCENVADDDDDDDDGDDAGKGHNDAMKQDETERKQHDNTSDGISGKNFDLLSYRCRGDGCHDNSAINGKGDTDVMLSSDKKEYFNNNNVSPALSEDVFIGSSSSPVAT